MHFMRLTLRFSSTCTMARNDKTKRNVYWHVTPIMLGLRAVYKQMSLGVVYITTHVHTGETAIIIPSYKLSGRITQLEYDFVGDVSENERAGNWKMVSTRAMGVLRALSCMRITFWKSNRVKVRDGAFTTRIVCWIKSGGFGFTSEYTCNSRWAGLAGLLCHG